MDDLNFERDLYEAKWLEKFHELEEFCTTNGDTKVTESNCSNKPLAQWVRSQRKNCEIEKRVKLLNSIGFVWNRGVTGEKPNGNQARDDF